LLHSTCVTFAMTDLNDTVLRYSAKRCNEYSQTITSIEIMSGKIKEKWYQWGFQIIFWRK